MTSRRLLIAVAITFAGTLAFSIYSRAPREEERRPLRLHIESIGRASEMTKSLLRAYEHEHGVKVELIESTDNATDRLTAMFQYFGARTPHIDIYMIDVIWPPMLADHLADLLPHLKGEEAAFFPRIVENNTVDGRLVAIPFYADVGLIYYRRDLLEKYGYSEPPAGWDELEQMAAAVQEGERAAGQTDFWSFLWPGAADESLTCFALELQHTHGGGNILDENGAILPGSSRTAAGFERARRWIGTISPPDTTTLDNEAARERFQAGRALFLRGWTYKYALLDGSDSPIRGKVGVAPIPDGGGGSASTLGGWQLAVSRYSPYKEDAAHLVRFLTAEPALLKRAVEGGFPPVRMSVYDAPGVTGRMPHLAIIREVLNGAIARPSKIAGHRYNEVSPVYFNYFHEILTGHWAAPQAIEKIRAELRTTLY